MIPKEAKNIVPPAKESQPVFPEERRLPLSNEGRDAFLRAIEEESEPTEAAKVAAARVKSGGK